MTETEIMKALECCIHINEECENCPYFENTKHIICTDSLVEDALALINRKNAEIERLEAVKKHIDTLIHRDCEYTTAETYNKAFFKALERLYDNATARAEAIKECLAKVEALFPFDKNFTTISRYTLRQIAKEMGVEL